MPSHADSTVFSAFQPKFHFRQSKISRKEVVALILIASETDLNPHGAGERTVQSASENAHDPKIAFNCSFFSTWQLATGFFELEMRPSLVR